MQIYLMILLLQGRIILQHMGHKGFDCTHQEQLYHPQQIHIPNIYEQMQTI